MNYKTFLTVILILTAISTIFICIAKPKMHKSVLVYSSEFKLVPQNEIQVEVENIPTITVVNNTPVKSTVIDIEPNQEYNIQNIDIQGINVSPNQTSNNQKVTAQGVNVKVNQTYIPQGVNVNVNQVYTPQKVTTQGVNVKTTSPSTKIVTTKPTNQNVKVNTPQLENSNIKTTSPQIDLQKILDNNKKIQAQNQPVSSKPVTSTPTQTTTNTNKIAQAPVNTNSTTPKVTPVQPATTPTKIEQKQVTLTPQEEEIAWQVWRSNLQNKIMQDVKLPNVPQGTTFKFSFDVDKYGKISNVHTTSTNSAYTPYAIQYIAPVIKSYQGRSILNFPNGSKRTTTEFIGSFRINNSSNKYSTTQDYKDTERIIK